MAVDIISSRTSYLSSVLKAKHSNAYLTPMHLTAMTQYTKTTVRIYVKNAIEQLLFIGMVFGRTQLAFHCAMI